MLSLLSLRLASRRVPLAPILARAAARPHAKIVSYSQTRLFLTSALRAEPPKVHANESTDAEEKPKSRKTSTKSTTKAAAKPKKKKKDAKPGKITIPRGLKVPKHGPSDFTHFLSAHFNPYRPKITAENLLERSREGAETWKTLSLTEKEKIHAEAQALRDKIKIDRKAFILSLDPKILKELNRRRLARGKSRIVAHRPAEAKRPSNQFILFANAYRQRHADEFKDQPVSVAAKKAAEVWRGMSDEEKEPYAVSYREAKEARKEENRE
ncbi:hypothetical protein FPV67DRAFT_1768212 [Lyophyllum atratum]|nr:hypothetical protein FPV67DRAFT_1768212 [Lyophyllum atratum]